ncbi:MAG TPA: RNA 3'-terminal phosphate cyclase [Thiobacillus sp.]|nr:MAG: RNA 3'-phosphate cyclase [Hydrogenophilales bacterium 16-64-40]OZA32516.1 MAG: RNA 3'-phosphate cyclase [Hydrogenophilales bacterium 17-64-65]HQS81905.1 RNA 3'-terminal phosphate cyclase [Thiobacillus sp.]HQT33969.1 RNA 3'-terminal phosphate cyclase [Thiobacillus sp.]
MIEIDASFGEGGGQILRSALALSVISRQAIRLTLIRARRPQPGMKPQHLKAVEAAAQISAAQVEGASPGSQTLRFEPTGLQGGKYAFDIGTAGAVSLLLQTVYLPLCFADGPSWLTLVGGTHVPWSPCYHYLQWQWLPWLAAAGYHVECSLERAGFYPRGGGLLHANIVPSRHLAPLRITERGRLLRIRGLSGVGRLDRSIAERQRNQAIGRLSDLAVPLEIEVAEVPAASPGTFIVLQAEFEGGRCCAFALGARHKPAEKVADEAALELRADIHAGGAIDAWLADQLLLPLAFVPGESTLSVCRISRHLRTNAELLRYFLPVSVAIEGETDQPGIVRLHGVAAPAS